jgi:hypothetical protein
MWRVSNGSLVEPSELPCLLAASLLGLISRPVASLTTPIGCRPTPQSLAAPTTGLVHLRQTFVLRCHGDDCTLPK